MPCVVSCQGGCYYPISCESGVHTIEVTQCGWSELAFESRALFLSTAPPLGHLATIKVTFFPRYPILNPEYLRWNNFSAINNPYKLLSALVDNLGASKGQFRPRVLFLWIVHGSAFQGKDEPGVMKIIEISERSSLFPRAAFTSWQLYPDDWLQALNPLTQPCRLLTGSLVGPASNSHGNQSFCGRAWGAWKHLCGPHGLSQLVGCVVTWSHLL